jgi:hypothetical protein
VSVANSLVGSSADDLVAGYGVTALANGNYVVRSSSWKNGTAMEAGAVTFGNGTTGTTGVISASNSLVGSNAQDFVGNRGVTALPNGNYVVSSMNWHNGELFNAGAVTFGSGTSGVTGEVSIANSLVGSSADDLVGLQDVTALAGGNYVVITPGWDFDVLLTDVGAVTLGSGTTGITGAITPANSVIGAMFADSVGQGGVMALSNGNYVVSSPFLDWDTQIDAGAVTFGNSAAGVGGTIDRSNSALGGGLATGLGLVVADNVNRNFYASFIEEDGGRVRVGSQIDGFSRPWHNVNRPMDVDNDLHVVAADALEVINFLNAGFGGPVDPEAAIGEPFGFLDVDGDDFVAPNDALDVINWLNAGLGGEGEASAESTREAGAPVRSAEWAAGPAAAVDAEELMGLLAGEWLGRRRR